MEIEHKGKTYKLKQEAYPSTDGKTYEALAIIGDDDFMVYWLVIDINRESDEVCDWNKVHKIEKL